MPSVPLLWAVGHTGEEADTQTSLQQRSHRGGRLRLRQAGPARSPRGQGSRMGPESVVQKTSLSNSFISPKFPFFFRFAGFQALFPTHSSPPLQPPSTNPILSGPWRHLPLLLTHSSRSLKKPDLSFTLWNAQTSHALRGPAWGIWGAGQARPHRTDDIAPSGCGSYLPGSSFPRVSGPASIQGLIRKYAKTNRTTPLQLNTH